MAQSIGAWLKAQDADVWDAMVGYLNWDNSVRTLKWIVSQRNCDKATAAKIFWLADPGFYACEIASGKGVPSWSESWPLIQSILEKWRAGFYTRSELAWPDDEGRAAMSSFERKTAQTPGADRALDIPPELFGPFRGRAPSFPPELTPQVNAEVWDMLKRQGTFAGPRPGSEQWQAEREKAASAAKASRWTGIFGRRR